MPSGRTSINPGDLSVEVDVLRGRIESIEREVEKRLDRVEEKISEGALLQSNRHNELMTAISALTTRHELTDQRSSIHHEGIQVRLTEQKGRIEALEASKREEMQSLIEKTQESGRHWVRYAVTTGLGFAIGFGSWVAMHFIK